MSDRARATVAGLLLAATCLAWLHAVHVIAGHAWFANYGLLLAALPAAVVASISLTQHAPRWRAIAAAFGMVMVFLITEWLEGELTAGHRIAWVTLADHGWPILISAGAAVAAAITWETARAIRLVLNELGRS